MIDFILPIWVLIFLVVRNKNVKRREFYQKYMVRAKVPLRAMANSNND